MKYLNHIILGLCLFFCFTAKAQEQETERRIDQIILNWHNAAAHADFATYTSLMTEDAIFIGTDPTENWKGEEFRDFAKPYFDQGTAWTFKTLERHIFFDLNYNVAWFDELLDTQMGICRGSGVLVKVGNHWKINHYVLSITIPNDNVKAIKEMNNEFNASFIVNLKKDN